MNTFIRLITMLTMAASLVSCIFEYPDENCGKEQTDSLDTQEIPVHFSVKAFDRKTKSSLSVDEDEVRSLSVYAFTGGKLGAYEYMTYPGDFTLSLSKGSTYNLYALSNMGEVQQYEDESELLGHIYSIRSISELSGAFPMAWKQTGLTVSGTGDEVDINLERLVSKVTFSIDKSEMGDFSVTGVKLRQGAMMVHPFSDNGSKVNSVSNVGDGDYASASDLSKLNLGQSVYFYALENCQGVLLPNNSNPDAKTPDNISSHSSLCTYLEMTASYSGDYQGVDVSSDNVVYRFYLGSDNCKDFNLVRNEDIYINLKVTEDRIFDESWKVSYGEDLPTISYGLECSESSVSLNVGKTGTLSLMYCKYADGTYNSGTNVTSYAAWTSNNEAVATVSNGVITGISTGTATITATYSGYKITCDVVVSDNIEYKLTLSPTSVTVVTGRTTKMTAVLGTFTNGVQTYGQDVSSSCTWTSSKSSVATIGTNGVITGVSSGTATITVVYEGQTLTGTVTVTPAYTYELILSPANMSLNIGESDSITATYKTYADGTLESSTDVTASATWSSSSAATATIAAGEVNALKVGKVTITATYNGTSGTATVNVISGPTLSLGWSSGEVTMGTSRSNAVLYHANNGTPPVNVTSSATWTSNDTSIATVSGGVITGVTAGTTTITAKYQNLSITCTVTVKPASVVQLSLTPINTSNNNYKLFLRITLSDGSVIDDAPYTWVVTNSQNASIKTGTSGTGPIIYTGGGTLFVTSFSITTTESYYRSDGTKVKWSTGTAISHNIDWKPK